MIARFYAPDPVGFADRGPGYFNRYAYTMNDPVNFIDPTGMYARGSGFTDEQWEKFDQVQNQAASDMRSTASDLMSEAIGLEKLGDRDAANGLRAEARSLIAGAEVLSGDEFTANVGNLGANEGSGTPAAVDPETRNVTVDMGHTVWSDSPSPFPEFVIGHESLHSAGLLGHASDEIRAGVRRNAYRYGDANERQAYRNIPMGSPRARRNPDHLMSRVYP